MRARRARRHALGILEKLCLLDIDSKSWPLRECGTFLHVGLCVHLCPIKHTSDLHQCRRRAGRGVNCFSFSFSFFVLSCFFKMRHFKFRANGVISAFP